MTAAHAHVAFLQLGLLLLRLLSEGKEVQLPAMEGGKGGRQGREIGEGDKGGRQGREREGVGKAPMALLQQPDDNRLTSLKARERMERGRRPA